MFDGLWLVLMTALTAGLLGSPHCMGMCGGITVALSVGALPQRKYQFIFIYHFFRILSYSILGTLAGGAGAVFSQWTKIPILTIIASILFVMMGLYLLGFWNILIYLEKAGQKLWKKISPIQVKFLPIRTYWQSAIVGLLWGFLPCGLVYSALAIASTSGSVVAGFLIMLFFGLGTLPAVMGTGLFGQGLIKRLRKPLFRRLMAIGFIALGGWQLYGVLWGGEHQHEKILEHSCH